MIRASIEPHGIGVAGPYDVKANAAAGDCNRIAVEKAKGNCLTSDVESTSALRFLDADGDFFAGELPVKLAGSHEFRQEPEVQASENLKLEPSPASSRLPSPRGRGRDAARMASTGTSEGSENNSG